jgi:hypothetical protein
MLPYYAHLGYPADLKITREAFLFNPPDLKTNTNKRGYPVD